MARCGARRPNCLDDFVLRFKGLRASPRYLLVLYVISFLDSVSYYAFSYALIMHLAAEVGLPDAWAGLFYGIFGVCISISSFFLGFAADWLGVRNSICVATSIGFVGRLAMAYAVLGRSAWLSTLLLCAVVGPCIALLGPPIPTAIKRFTRKDTRELGYTLNYGVVNVGAFMATPIVDILRLNTGDTVMLLPPYALLIAFTGLMQLPIFFAALFGLRDEYMDEQTGEMRPFVAEGGDSNLKQRIKAVLAQANFWRALTLVMCLMGVKSSFRYFDALFLPYVLRAYQDAASFPYLSLLALNPIIVIAATLTGASTIITSRMTIVNSMLVGTFVGGVAPMCMAVGPYLTPIILYVLCTSIGEVIWAPVAVTFLMSLTKNGEEGAYFALAGLPTFMGKVLTGGLTGGLLSVYCPQRYAAVGAVRRFVLAALDSFSEFVELHWSGLFGVESTLPGRALWMHWRDAVNASSTLLPPPPPQLWGAPECSAVAIWGIIGLTTLSSFFMLLAVRRYIASVETVATPLLLQSEEDTDDIELEGIVGPIIIENRAMDDDGEPM